MDKVKSLLGGGSKNHDDSTYDQDSYSQTATHNSGKLTGEGSHLSSATGNTGTTSAGVDSTTTGPHSSTILNHADPRVDSTATQDNNTSSVFANKAASTAWPSQHQSTPGGLPQEDTSNPYAASGIDPRVDNVPRTQDSSVGTAPTDSTTGSGLGSATSDVTGTSNNQSMMNRALGAVGLGGTAARADEQNPSTTTGTHSHTTPTPTGVVPSHHRKESIPTTAYPSGTLDAPRAVAPPVGVPASGNSAIATEEPGAGGGTGRAAVEQTSTYGSHYLGSGEPTSSVVDPNSSDPNTYRKPETSHLGRDAGIGAGVGVAGVGAALAHDGSRNQPGVQSGVQSGAPTDPAGGEHTAFYDAATVGHQPLTSSGLGDTGTSQAHDMTSAHHPGRDTAALGAGAGALGAGAYESEKHRGAQDPATGTPTGIGSTTGSTTATSQPHDQEGHRHLGRDAAAAGAGVGAVGVGAHEHSKHEEKEREKEQKAHDKALAKDKKYYERVSQKEERYWERQEEKEEKKERAHERHSHHTEEAAAAGTVGAGAVGAHEHDQHHDNLGTENEKERKPSIIQRILHPRSSKTSGHGDTTGLAAADAADGRAFHDHGDASATRKSSIPHAGYAEAPTKGYASQVTGGTGTTALALGEGAPSGSHATALGNVVESKDPSARSGSAATYPTEGGQFTAGAGRTEAPSTGYASQGTGGADTTALAEGNSSNPLNTSTGIAHDASMGQGSLTGQTGTAHHFGETSDHKH